MKRLVNSNGNFYQYLFVLLVFLVSVCNSWQLEGNTQRIPWLVVGGGIHGVHMATRLLGERVTEDLVIVDECQELLYKWKTRTAATGMKYLRSSAGYHLDLSENSLRLYAKRKRKRKDSRTSDLLLSTDYERPQLDFFEDHCNSVIKKYNLRRRHLKGKVTTLDLLDDSICVSIQQENHKTMKVKADRVVLAVGNDEPLIPSWVTQEAAQSGLVGHLLNDRFNATVHRASLEHKLSIAIVGGGLTAAHKALQLTQSQEAIVHMICRKELREQQFDTHQDWMMDYAAALRSEAEGGSGLPERQKNFRNEESPRIRKEVIQKERIAGTVTAEVHRGKGGLKYAIEQGRVRWHKAEINDFDLDRSSGGLLCTLTLSSGETITVDKVFLATGFGTEPPAQELLSPLDLPRSDFCGYPLVNDKLQWGHQRLFVMGALAELELGPSARNIAGARLAAERIVDAANVATGLFHRSPP